MTTGSPMVSSLPMCRSSSRESSSLSNPRRYGVRSTFCSSLNTESFPSISIFTERIFSAAGLNPKAYRLVFHRSVSGLRENRLVTLAFPVLSRETRYRPVEIPVRVPCRPARGVILPETLIWIFSRWTNADGVMGTRLGLWYSRRWLKPAEHQNFCTPEMYTSPSRVSVRAIRRAS